MQTVALMAVKIAALLVIASGLWVGASLIRSLFAQKPSFDCNDTNHEQTSTPPNKQPGSF